MKNPSQRSLGSPFVSIVILGLMFALPMGRAATAGPSFPLKVSTNGRYFVDQLDRPFRLNCEAAWLMSVQATKPEVEAYLADREAKGFTAIILMAMVHADGYAARDRVGKLAPQAPRNQAGDSPLAVGGDFSSKPNEAYWRFIDLIIDRAAAHHLVVVLAYTYLGYDGGNEGWWREINWPINTRAVCYNWGVWLGRRYRDRPNIIWYACGDYAPPTGSEGSRRVHAMIEGIKSVIPTALFGAEMDNPNQLSTDVPDFAAVMDMNSFYGDGPNLDQRVFLTADRAWTNAPAKPAWVGEPNYYGEDVGGGTGSRTDTRVLQWSAVLGGGTAGDSTSSRHIWTWTAWRNDLNIGYSTDRQHLFSFFAALPWYELVPSGIGGNRVGRVLITSRNPADRSRIVSCAAPSGEWLVAYMPPARAAERIFSVDLRAMSGSVRARWFNPTSGAYTAIGTGLANTAAQQFTTPGENGTGASDWVLVLDTIGAHHQN